MMTWQTLSLHFASDVADTVACFVGLGFRQHFPRHVALTRRICAGVVLTQEIGYQLPQIMHSIMSSLFQPRWHRQCELLSICTL